MSAVQAASLGGTAQSSTFSVSISWSGSTSINVAGSSGTMTPSQGVFAIIESGGVTPYGQSPTGLSFGGGSSPKLIFANSSDGVHTTLGWTGLTVGQQVSCSAIFQDTDSAGTTRSSTSQLIFVTRTT